MWSVASKNSDKGETVTMPNVDRIESSLKMTIHDAIYNGITIQEFKQLAASLWKERYEDLAQSTQGAFFPHEQK